MKRLEKYCMQDYMLKENNTKRFCIAAFDMEQDDWGPYKNGMIIYTPGADTRLQYTYVSDSALKRNIKWLKTSELRDEALHWALTIPFIKGVALGNDNHDISAIDDIIGRFREMISGKI